MNSSVDFSLIVATAGRIDELDAFLKSLCQSEPGSPSFEVLLCDQNPAGFLDALIHKYAAKMSLIHILSERKGLSFNRNLGIKRAKGKFLAFPDDDCEYYSDTLKAMGDFLKTHQSVKMLIGTVFDRKTQSYVFKKTPSVPVKVTLNNFHSFVSSIAFAVRNEHILFDENFGIGEKFHSNEDADLILQCLEKGFEIQFIPELQFYHPPYNAATMSKEKLLRYGIGFGALCRKHLSAPIMFLYFKVIVYQVLMQIKSILTFNFEELRRRSAALNGRLKGFFNYRAF